uniref:HotDog ACOT-type domain-containing protein n=1 Tax=Auxenochlorella protothecoides TaxID=3075 RepID=A0A1D1ZMD4_AUXPR
MADTGALIALMNQVEALAARVKDLESKSSNGNGMDFLQRHEGLSLRRPPSLQSLAGAGGPGMPRAPSYTNLSHVEVPMPSTRVVMTQIVSPADTTGAGICSGGTVLSWIDVAAGLAAKTLARAPVVTASLDTVHFLRPCRLQSIVTIAAMVNRVFASSMEVGVQVEEEDLSTGSRHHCCSAYLTFVALSRRGGAGGGAPPQKKLPPKVVPTDSYYQEIFDEAAARREARLADRERLRSDPDAAAAEAGCRLLPVAHRPSRATLEAPLPSLGSATCLGAGGEGPGPATEGPGAAEGPGSQRGARPPGARCVVRPARTAAHMTQLIMPQHANSLGIAFGGAVMRWMEQCAFVAAARVARGAYLLTASMDSIAFAAPTRVGDIMYIEAQATAIFGSSVEVMISVWAETPEAGGLFECGDAYATVVSMNESGVPQDIPFELAPDTPEDHTRHAGAIRRRRDRLQMREAMRQTKRKRKALDGMTDRWGSTDDFLSHALHAGSGNDSPGSGPASRARTEHEAGPEGGEEEGGA